MRAVSIHAPAWGATIRSTLDKAITRRFNPRARVGRDGLLRVAPAAPTGFNPRARVGRDIAKFTAREYMKEFQSTRPRGARPSPINISTGAASCFNPRARVGRDRMKILRKAVHGLFQSTRPRGARPLLGSALVNLRVVSIHAPAWGATSYIVPFCKKNVPVSIHAPAWGATRMLRTSARGLPSFNPRARVGRDSRSWLARRRMRCFNPRARVGRDAIPCSMTP